MALDIDLTEEERRVIYFQFLLAAYAEVRASAIGDFCRHVCALRCKVMWSNMHNESDTFAYIRICLLLHALLLKTLVLYSQQCPEADAYVHGIMASWK